MSEWGDAGVDSREGAKQMLEQFLRPWHESVVNPSAAQERVLTQLLRDYARTEYGIEHGADRVSSVEDYRAAFPVVTYEEVKPLIDRVMAGEEHLLLSEPPVGWAITRGTTRGESKFIPMTASDLKMRASAGRALMNYIARSGQFEILRGVNLNLNFPSMVGTVKVGEREVEYGYSSGIYVKHTTAATPLRTLPSQEEIDALGGGKTIRDWERRFELAYERCKGEDVSIVGGVAPTAVDFGKYLHHAHKVYPKDLWAVRIMTLGSVPGINTKYCPVLRAMYGAAEIAEIYGTTEGMFGQQRDDKRAWVPNYDLFLFEVETRGGIKMMHEMRPGETGSLVVSTPILPRYKIGDLIKAFQPPYYRCIGRDRPWTPLRYWWDELVTMDLGRL
ncbi:MAG TPA: hypothetical protein ENO24_10105 [Chloroflexi bacterium]|nr:hypothetical protein [Chloroflexota bacterium]